MISIEQSDANKAMKQKEKRINCSIILGLISAYFVTLQVPELSQSGSSICTIAPPPPLLFHILYLVGWEYLPVRCMGTNGVTSPSSYSRITLSATTSCFWDKRERDLTPPFKVCLFVRLSISWRLRRSYHCRPQKLINSQR